MIQLSEATAIALHSMIYISNRKERLISLKEIANIFNISENHLSKILQRLVKSGFLTSAKGPKGGFRIIEDKINASYLDIYEAIEGKWHKKDCLFANKVSQCNQCIMGGLVGDVNQLFYDYMNNHKISEFKL